jgi:hypothetical protein
MSEIALFFSRSPEYEIHFVASHPAIDIIRGKGLPVKSVNAPSIDTPSCAGAGDLLREANELISEVRPHAILVGLSGPGIGIDEALVFCAGDCPTYAIQDFWGDVNLGFGAIPKTFFVMDKEAAYHTQQRVDSDVIVVGSPRHSRMARQIYNHDFGEISHKHHIEETGFSLLFCGQPLWHLNGYQNTLSILAAYLHKSEFRGTIYYRPHPKENKSNWLKAVEIFARYGLNSSVDEPFSLERSLCRVDLVCTCFSNCGIDLAYLNRCSPLPLAGLIYILFDDEVYSCYKNYSKLTHIPIAEIGSALTVTCRTFLLDNLKKASAEDWRSSAWNSAKTFLPDPANSLNKIYNQLRFDLNNRVNL